MRADTCGLSIREATEQDAAAIAQVHVRSWRAAYAGILPDELLERLSVDQRAASWRDWIAEGTLVLLGSAEGTLLGFCAVAGTEIAALYVDPPCTGRGIGATLLAEAQRRLRAAGAREATLWVFAANRRVRRFYESNGWQADGETDTHHTGAPEIRLHTSLASSDARFRSTDDQEL